MGNRASVQRIRSTEENDLSQQLASDEYAEEKTLPVHYCDPCNNAGEKSEAFGFCVECKECLCRICYKSHSRDMLSESHTLLSREAIPGQIAKTCGPCEKVGDEIEAEGFCSDCKAYLCVDCFKGHSRSKLSKHHILYHKTSMPEGKSNIAENSTYKEQYSLVEEMNVKFDPDKPDTLITGLALISDHELVMTDELNKAVILYDKKKYQIWEFPMKSVPNRITAISYDQVAVVLRNECTIEIRKILQTRERFPLVRSLKTDGICVDVEYVNTKLYVSFRRPIKFQILDLTGIIKKTINPDDTIVQNCDSPSRIAVSSDERLIFMADWNRNSFMSMNMDGHMVSLYQPPLSEPGDIVISPFGLIYICIRRKHIIYKMKLDFSDVTVIVGGSNDDIKNPLALCLDPSKQHLYVSSGSANAEHRNLVKVFKWR